jgi:hypothetical protein
MHGWKQLMRLGHLKHETMQVHLKRELTMQAPKNQGHLIACHLMLELKKHVKMLVSSMQVPKKLELKKQAHLRRELKKPVH